MSSASPGGVQVSSAKKRRLAALDAASATTGERASPLCCWRSRKGDVVFSRTASVAFISKYLLAGIAVGIKRGRETPLPIAVSGKQQPLVSASGWRSSVAATANLGRGSQQEAHELQYATLAQSLADGPILKSLVPAGLQTPMSVDALLESVLKTNPRVPDARTAIASRVHNKVFLLDNPTAALTTKPKYKKHNKRLSGQLLSCKKRPTLGTNHKYSHFTPLHKLWQQYMEELLKLSQGREACILTADFHGCSLQVMQAANPVHVGLAGIIIKDTAATFTIITQSDHVKYIPKHGSTFCFSLDDRATVTMFGTSLQRERSKS